MYDIIIVFTRHKELGKCNSYELFKIIERIKPQVVFEELSELDYNKAYVQKTLGNLENVTIEEYVKSHRVEHIPVDTYQKPKGYDEQVDLMYDRIFKSNLIEESRDLRYLMDKQGRLVKDNGFDILNSEVNDAYFNKVAQLKDFILKSLNDEKLFRISELERETIAKREHQILRNIYDYSSVNPYSKAMMFIGSGHRESILKVIQAFDSTEKVKLNWIVNYKN